MLSNAVIGFFFGVLPGHGATAASFLGYGLARQYSKNKENFGKGEISGIMGPQAAADSAGVASLVPMITLGIPGSPTSAVIMAGLFVWGLQPGPVLFIQHPDFVWGLIASIYLGHLLTFILCLLAVPLLAMIMRVPYAIITPFIVVISIIGSYSLNNSMLDVFITVVFGVIGYWLRKMKYPLAPLVVALVLGDSTERELRKALIGSPHRRARESALLLQQRTLDGPHADRPRARAHPTLPHPAGAPRRDRRGRLGAEAGPLAANTP